MADTSAGSFRDARSKLSESIERNIERAGRVAAQLDRTLVSLSAGALVFSMTFVGTFAPRRLLLPVLFCAWGAFAGCLTFIIFGMRAEQNAIRKATGNFDSLLKQLDAHEPLVSAAKLSVKLTLTFPAARWVLILNKCAIAAFMLGLALLGFFIGYNLWHTPYSR
jgi:hypothetical protein